MNINQNDMNSTPVGNSPERAESQMSDDKTDLIDPNSLIAMPDHIIDQIFDSLDDLADRKSLSESCKRFNGIFSHPLHLNKVWLDLKKSPVAESLIASSRVYQNLKWNRNLPVEILRHLSPNLKSLKIQISPDNSRNLEDSLAKILPFGVNLIHLEIKLFQISLELIKPELNCNFDRVSMKNLRFLKMDMQFFTYLSDHFIDFSSTVKLQTIDIARDDGFEYDDFETDDCYNKIRALISSQKQLKILSLEVNKNFFDQKLVLQSKLKKLELGEHLFFVNSEQAANFLDFVESQDELENFEVLDAVFPECKERVKNFKQKRLNLKLVDIEILFWNEKDSSRHHLASVDKTMLAGPQNLTVEQIHMYFGDRGVSGDIESYFPLINSKFPNVTYIVLCSYLQIDFTALKDFKKVTGLSLVVVDSESLESIAIPNLKFFRFNLDESMTDDQIKEFFMRHKEIETLVINCEKFSITCSKKLVEVVGYALKNLKLLKSINVLEEPKVKGKYENSDINIIITSMDHHAQPGFLFKSTEGLEVFKLDDMKIVRKYKGRWVRVIN